MVLLKKLLSQQRVGCRQISLQYFKFTRLKTSGINQSFKSFNTVLCRQTSTRVIHPEPMLEISNRARKVVGIWLMTCAGVTFTTVIIGGITRLTKSGLSMVTWHPFKEVPPRSEEQWHKEFEKYKQYPEFKIYNQEMTLQEFKRIWYMEYAHRTLGRSIGALYFLPAALFWYKKYFTKAMKKRVIAFGLLLGAQGLLGWYMVKSGLEENAVQEGRVSQYRLAAHLATAFIFYSLLLWSGLSHLLPPQPTTFNRQMTIFRRMVHPTKGLIFLTALSGAFVAGTGAGLVYNSFPKMADRWVPTDLWTKTPTWKNFTENLSMIQFNHRILGELVFAAVSSCWAYSRRLPLTPRTRLAINCLMLAVWGQVGLGIANILLYCPKSLAASHQAGALTTLSVVIWLTHELKLAKAIKAMPK